MILENKKTILQNRRCIELQCGCSLNILLYMWNCCSNEGEATKEGKEMRGRADKNCCLEKSTRAKLSGHTPNIGPYSFRCDSVNGGRLGRERALDRPS